MLSVKQLQKIFIGKSKTYLYKRIREIKCRYNLHYSQAELPIDILIKETHMTRETIYDILGIKKAD